MTGKIRFGKLLEKRPWDNKAHFVDEGFANYRMEEIKGEWKKGDVIISGDQFKSAGYVKMYEGDEFRSIIPIYSGIMQTIMSPDGHKKNIYRTIDISVPQGELCKDGISGLVKAWPELSKKGEALKLLGGDFDGDGKPDFAYVIKEPSGGLKSYVFFSSGRPISECFEEKNREAWPVIEKMLDSFLHKHRQLVPFVIKYFQDNAGRISDLIMDRKYLVPILKEYLPKLVRDFRACYRTKTSRRDSGWPKADLKCNSKMALAGIENFLVLIERHKDSEELVRDLLYDRKLDMSTYVNRESFYDALTIFDEGIKDAKKLSCAVGLFRGFLRMHDIEEGKFLKPLVKAILRAVNRLSADENLILMSVVKRLDDEYDFGGKKAKDIVPEFVKIAEKVPDKKLYMKLYRFFCGSTSVSPGTMFKYKEILKNHVAPKFRDIEYAEKHLGPENAELLWKKFGIIRFGRYQSAVLSHLIKLAHDKDYKKDKPLILYVGGKSDYNDAFYYSFRYIDHDPRLRQISVESGNYNEFKRLLWRIRKDYGIPDVLVLSSHGAWNDIAHIAALKDGKRMRKDFKGIFGDRPPQIIMDSCSTGAPPMKGVFNNIAQMFANLFKTEVHAPRSRSLAWLPQRIDIINGRARLTPLFFETGLTWFGFNYNGMIFKPWKKGEIQKLTYTMPWEANLGWQFGLSTGTYAGKFLLGGSVGGTIAPFSHFRLRLDAGLDATPTSGEIYPAIKPEIAFGLTNHLMFATGAAIGLRYKKNTGFSRHIETHAGLKILLNAINSELDIGASWLNDHGWQRSLYLGLQTRF